MHYALYWQNPQTCFLTIGNGNLVSGTSLNAGANIYGLTMSHSPFNGTASVSTINYYISFNGISLSLSPPHLFYCSIIIAEPEFIDLYERGDHYYFFMRETARETGDVSLRPVSCCSCC